MIEYTQLRSGHILHSTDAITLSTGKDNSMLLENVDRLGATLYMLWGGNVNMGEDGNGNLPWMGRAERVALLEAMLAHYFSSRINLNAFKAWFAKRHGGWFDANGNLPAPGIHVERFERALQDYILEEATRERVNQVLDEFQMPIG